jgi:hypothetical protein
VVYPGDRVRTGPRSSAVIFVATASGAEDRIDVMADSIVEVPDIPNELRRRFKMAATVLGVALRSRSALAEPILFCGSMPRNLADDSDAQPRVSSGGDCAR